MSLLERVRRIRRIWSTGEIAIRRPAIVARTASVSAVLTASASSLGRGRARLRLAGALARLVLRKGLGRVDVTERRGLRDHLVPARRLDAVPLAEQREDRAGLHLADAGQRDEPLVEIAGIGGLGPDARRIATVVVRDRLAQLAHPLGHVPRKAVQGRRG